MRVHKAVHRAHRMVLTACKTWGNGFSCVDDDEDVTCPICKKYIGTSYFCILCFQEGIE